MNQTPEELRENLRRNSWPMGEPTVIDAIARLSHFDTLVTLGEWAQELPESIKSDDRFKKAVKQRLSEIKGK